MPSLPALRRAFTLIELIVAVTILVILAGLIIPRVAATARAEQETAVDAVEELLAMYAFREATSAGQQVALWQDPATGDLALLVKGSALAAPGETPTEQEWTEDIFTQAVRLPESLRLVEVTIDGEAVTGSDWMAPSVPGGGRPSIELRLESDLVHATLALSPSSMTPVRQQEGRRPVVMREAVDLDRSAEGNQW